MGGSLFEIILKFIYENISNGRSSCLNHDLTIKEGILFKTAHLLDERQHGFLSQNLGGIARNSP